MWSAKDVFIILLAAIVQWLVVVFMTASLFALTLGGKYVVRQKKQGNLSK